VKDPVGGRDGAQNGCFQECGEQMDLAMRQKDCQVDVEDLSSGCSQYRQDPAIHMSVESAKDGNVTDHKFPHDIWQSCAHTKCWMY
jgi:hypothetical protein